MICLTLYYTLQVKIAKMENLHTKRQNVLTRKMEEAQAAKKRLEEIINKQKASNANKPIGKQVSLSDEQFDK